MSQQPSSKTQGQKTTGKVINITSHVRHKEQIMRQRQKTQKSEIDHDELDQITRRSKPSMSIMIVPILALILSFSMAAYVAFRDAPKDTASSGDTTLQNQTKSASQLNSEEPKPVLSAEAVERVLTEGQVQGVKLEDLAIKIVRTESWSESDILQVALAWEKYSHNQKLKLRETVWFQLLENNISQRVSLYRSKKVSSSERSKKELLLGLAKSLDIEIRKPLPKVAVNTSEKEVKILAAGTKPEKNVVPKQIKPELQNTQLQVPNVITPQHEVGHMSAEVVQSRPEVVAVAPELVNKFKASMNRPTAAQLDAVAMQFVDAYESGDITKFTSLFALDAFSNNQNNLNAIKKEYESLFRATSERQMFMENLGWHYNKNKAIGKARLKVLTMNNNDSNVYNFHGRIQFVVEKQQNDVVIVKLYHLLEAVE